MVPTAPHRGQGSRSVNAVFRDDGIEGPRTADEINSAVTETGERITTNTMYYRGNVVMQNITIRDDQGKIRTTNVIGGKLLP